MVEGRREEIYWLRVENNYKQTDLLVQKLALFPR